MKFRPKSPFCLAGRLFVNFFEHLRSFSAMNNLRISLAIPLAPPGWGVGRPMVKVDRAVIVVNYRSRE